jgi:hypothetical protein
MIIDAWWYNYTQKDEDYAWAFDRDEGLKEYIRAEYFGAKTHLGIYAAGTPLFFPVRIKAEALIGGEAVFQYETEINDMNVKNEDYYFKVSSKDGVLMGSFIAKALAIPPEHIVITITSGDNVFSQQIKCEYVELSGKIVDFNDKPYPALFDLARYGFNGHIRIWSDENGKYSVTVPKGRYNMFYICDSQYGKTVLENWGWHMIVDRDEVHDFKIGTGEVYSLCPWSNNGGSATLFFFFRPMVLNKPVETKMEFNGHMVNTASYQTVINCKTYNVTDTSPDLTLDSISVTINSYPLHVISLQKFYETSGNNALPAYIIQTRRVPESNEYSTLGKQTVIVEYSMKMENGHMAQSQGRTQFFYSDSTALSIL